MPEHRYRRDEAGPYFRSRPHYALELPQAITPPHMAPLRHDGTLVRAERPQQLVVGKPPILVWRAYQQRAARAQDAERFSDGGPIHRNVLNHVEHRDRREAVTRKRQARGIAANEAGPALLVTRRAGISGVAIQVEHTSARIEQCGESASPTTDLQHFLQGLVRRHLVDGAHLLAIEETIEKRFRKRIPIQEIRPARLVARLQRRSLDRVIARHGRASHRSRENRRRYLPRRLSTTDEAKPPIPR